MKKIKDNDILGKTYGDYTIIGNIRIKSNCILVECKCNVCGRIRDMWYKDIKKGIGIEHYLCSKTLEKDKIYYKLQNTHSKIKDRCNNKNNNRFVHYGARNIKCEFELFIDFYDYAKPLLINAMNNINSNMYKLSIDRIDNNKGYIKGNLRFVEQKVQVNNSRKILNRTIIVTNKDTNVSTEFNGLTIQEFAKRMNWTEKQSRSRIGEKKYKNLTITVVRCND